MMTLGNMRENDVRSLAIMCGAGRCNHHAVLDVSAFADHVTVPSFGARMVSRSVVRLARLPPNWNERAQPCLYGHHGS